MCSSHRGESDDEISDVLLVKMGDVVPTPTQNLSKFPCQLVREWLAEMGFQSENPQDVVKADKADKLSNLGGYPQATADAFAKVS